MSYRIDLRSRPDQHFTYSGRSVLVSDLDGQVRGGRHGLFVANTRFLSRDELGAPTGPLRAISASPVGGDAFLAYYEVPASAGVPPASVYVERSWFVGEGMRSVVRVRSYARERCRVELVLRVDADFADSEEVQNGKRRQEAAVERSWSEADRELILRYCHPSLDRATAVRVEGGEVPVRSEEDALRFVIDVGAQAAVEYALVVEPVFDGRRAATTTRRSFARRATAVERLQERLASDMPRLVTTNATVQRAWETATRDLASLVLGLEGAPATPIAGLPLYLELFGRDSLTIGWQALMATPELLRDALVANAAWQGSVIDDWRDEEPGKMLHRAGGGPLSDLGLDPFDRYYGDWATPPDFLIMLGQYLTWTADIGTVRRLLPAARAALDWLDRYGDLDHDGFLEYETRSPHGDKNQGWKDSDDAIVDERGEFPENPVATSELQAYWYAALQQAALVFLATGDAGYAADLALRARDVRRRFNESFWMEDVGLYALGLGRDKRQLRSIGSNDGHLLASGIVPPERGRRVARRLMEPDIFSGWGIRTLASTHPAYNPFSYHRGSVWPVEQATIALGFARYGAWTELHRLAEGVFAASDLFVANRLPEVLGGLPRDDDHPHPGIYPDSCEPQGWSASAVVMLVQALLGLLPVAPLRLVLVDPHLPEWLPDLRLDGLRVRGAEVDLEFRRDRRGRTSYRVAARRGSVRVIRQPPPQAPGAGPLGRAAALAGSVIRR